MTTTPRTPRILTVTEDLCLNPSLERKFSPRIAMSVAIYGGAKCPTLKTAGKHSRKRCRVGPGQTAAKQPEKQPKHPKDSCFDCVSGVFLAVCRLLDRASVDGLGDCKQRRPWFEEKLLPLALPRQSFP